MKSILIILFICIAGCTTGGILKSDKPATVMKLNQDFKLLARIGNLPTVLSSKELITRYSINQAGRPPDYFVVISPSLADGEITLPTKSTEDTVESAVQFNRYLDLLLRSYRLFLKGEIETAQLILNKLDEDYDPSYGTLVLAGNIALIEGDVDTAQKNFSLAKRIFPDAKGLPTESEAP